MLTERTGSLYSEVKTRKRKDGSIYRLTVWRAQLIVEGVRYKKQSKYKEVVEKWLYEQKKAFQELPIINLGRTPRKLELDEKRQIALAVLYERSQKLDIPAIDRKACRNMMRRVATSTAPLKNILTNQRSDVWTEEMADFMKMLSEMFG